MTRSNPRKSSSKCSTASSLLRQSDPGGVESDSNSNCNSNSRSHSTAYSTACSNSNYRNHPDERPESQSGSNSNSNVESRTNSRSYSQSRSTSKSLPSVVCIEGNKSVFTAMVGRVVKHSIFPKKQFIILDRELDENSNVANSCLRELKLERSKWYSVRNLVRIQLNRVRNNVQQCVRKKLHSKFLAVSVSLRS